MDLIMGYLMGKAFGRILFTLIYYPLVILFYILKYVVIYGFKFLVWALDMICDYILDPLWNHVVLPLLKILWRKLCELGHRMFETGREEWENHRREMYNTTE